MTAFPSFRRAPMPLAGALLIGAALILARVDQSLWSDEGSSVWFARQPIGALLSSACDPHPPLYYLLLKVWLQGGESETWLRTSSLVSSLLVLGLTYGLARRLFGSATAGWTVLLLALHPMHSWYGSEVRMYALAEALSVLLVWLGVRWLESGSATSRRWILAYELVMFLALWTDYTVLLIWCFLQLMWIARGMVQRRHWLLSQLAVLILWGLLESIGVSFNGAGQGYQAIFLALQANQLGVALTPEIISIILAGLMLAAGMVGVASALLWPRYSRSIKPWLLNAAFLVWTGLALLAATGRLYTVQRLLLVALPLLTIAVARMLVNAPRLRQAVVVTLAGLLAVLAVLSQRRPPWRDVVAEVIRHSTSTPSVIWVDDFAAPIFEYYARRASAPVSWTLLSGRALPALPAAVPPRTGLLWIVADESPYRKIILFLPPAFQAEYDLMLAQREAGLGLYLYRRREIPRTQAAPAEIPPVNRWGLDLPSPLDHCEK